MNDPESDYVNMVVELGKLEKTKQWDAVESYAKTIIQRFPTSIYALKRLGIALVKQKKFSEAVTCYEKAVNVGKTFGAGHLEYIKQLDVLYRQLGRYEDAFQICSYYLSQDKNSKDAINRFNRSAKLTGRTELTENLVVVPMKKRVPLGKPLPPIKSNIFAPTTKEIDKMISHWNESVPEEYRGILEAQPIEKPNRAISDFVFNAKTREYTNLITGKVVTMRELARVFRNRNI